MVKDNLLRELNSLPEHLQLQVMDFVLFLKNAKIFGNVKQPKVEQKKIKAGFGKYKVTMSPDFDEPLEDFKDYMP